MTELGQLGQWLQQERPVRKLEAVASAAALILILIVVTVVYAPTLHDAFHGDDFVAFTEFKTKSFLEFSKGAFLFENANFYWRPLGNIFHYCLYGIFGLDPFAYRSAELGFFLLTLVALYLFCVGERLGKLTALGSVLILGLLPSHVVSVTWVTNTSRVTSALFVVVSLLLIQRARTSRRAFIWEAAAFLAFVIAALNDESTTALAPVPFLYGTFVARERLEWRGAITRLVFYAALVAVIVPLQFTYTIDDEARLTQYSFGPHILTSVWVLASQLSLPLVSGSPVAVMIHLMPPEEWAAGLATLVACAILFVVGSRQLKFLVFWLGLAFAPFALWEPQNISPRYVYLAAMPFSILVAWAVARALTAVANLLPRSTPGFMGRMALAQAGLALVLAFSVFAIRGVESRNEAWSAETARYGVLREALEAEFPEIPPGTRLIVFYGQWPDFWASAVARTIYGDRWLWVTSVSRERVDLVQINAGPNDLVVYLLKDRLMQVNSRR
jgi:hypothetical protein